MSDDRDPNKAEIVRRMAEARAQEQAAAERAKAIAKETRDGGR